MATNLTSVLPSLGSSCHSGLALSQEVLSVGAEDTRLTSVPLLSSGGPSQDHGSVPRETRPPVTLQRHLPAAVCTFSSLQTPVPHMLLQILRPAASLRLHSGI